MTERFTFGDTEIGLTVALGTVRTLRAAGFRVRLVTGVFHGFVLHTVLATPETRPNRAARGCNL